MSCGKTILIVIVYILYFLIIGPLGTRFCKAIYDLYKIKKEVGATTQPQSGQGAGRLIGYLERVLIALGILVKSWEVLVAVVALKTVARYKELDTQINAEYFLVGSLVSILIAVISTMSLVIIDKNYGFDILSKIGPLFSGSN